MKEIQLSQGRITFIDDEDYEWVCHYKWCVSAYRDKCYAVRRNPETGSSIRLHREIMKAPKGKEVDHINGDTLDNRKKNLRICEHKQNIANQKLSSASTTGYKGVCYRKDTRKWSVYIKVNQKKIHLGNFDDLMLAAQAYNMAAKEYFGEFARINNLE